MSLNMGIRQWLNERPGIASGVAVLAVAVTVVGIILEIRASRPRFPTGSPSYYFTVDDGQTYFAASSDNFPPFDYNGQEAVGAYVFECNGKRFVGYLERYTPEAHALMVAGKGTAETRRFGRELKRPGDKVWVKSGNLDTEAKITNVVSPDGQGVPELLMP
jgi:hypothetical protein